MANDCARADTRAGGGRGRLRVAALAAAATLLVVVPLSAAASPAPFLLGDSLAIGSSEFLQTAPGGVLAVKSINSRNAVRRATGHGGICYPSWRCAYRTLVVSLGTNNDPGQVASFARDVDVLRRVSRCVVWDTISLPSHWRLNQVLLEHKRQHPTTFRLAGWASAVASGRVALADGVHAGPDGYRVLAGLQAAQVSACP